MSQREKASDPKPYYDAHVFCCTNRRPAGHPRGCCAEKGSEALRDYMKGRAKDLGLKNVRINSAGCLDRCELGPTVVIYPEGVWYACADQGRHRRGAADAPGEGRPGRAPDAADRRQAAEGPCQGLIGRTACNAVTLFRPLYRYASIILYATA